MRTLIPRAGRGTSAVEGSLACGRLAGEPFPFTEEVRRAPFFRWAARDVPSMTADCTP